MSNDEMKCSAEHFTHEKERLAKPVELDRTPREKEIEAVINKLQQDFAPHIEPPRRGKREVVYGCLGKNLVFILRSEAARLARIHYAVATSETWGEFRSRMPRQDYEAIAGDDDRQSFAHFCQPWINDLPGRDEQRALNQLRYALRDYVSLSADERWPLPSERKDFSELLGDGDWPEWPAQLMLDWVPRNIQERYGTRQNSVLNGSFLEFPREKVAEIVTALTEARYHCVESQLAVELASGEAKLDGLRYADVERFLDELEGIESPTPDIAAGINRPIGVTPDTPTPSSPERLPTPTKPFGLAHYDQPESLEFISICGRCCKLKGAWGEHLQHCDCQEKPIRRPDESREDAITRGAGWGAGWDVNTAVELCYCCGLELLHVRSKCAKYFCEDCEQRVSQFNDLVGRCVLPVSRYGPTNVAKWGYTDKSGYELLAEFARENIRSNLRLLGFDPLADVATFDYLKAASVSDIHKSVAFDRLILEWSSQPTHKQAFGFDMLPRRGLLPSIGK